ncbi:MAG: SHOCT domain-containing protein [Gammaproteobacteria bacterium]
MTLAESQLSAKRIARRLAGGCFTLGAASYLLAGCASAPSIQPVSSSRSIFEGAVYTGQTGTLNAGTPGNTEFRVFRQAATGFVSMQSVRSDAEQSATAFCDRKAKVMNPLRETVAKPPYILGNFPRIEIIFECSDKVLAPQTDESKYEKLGTLKTLLDSGALTQAEYEKEKAKVLRQP